MSKQPVRTMLWIVTLVVVLIVGGVNPLPTQAGDQVINQSPTREPDPVEPTPTPEAPSDWLATVQEDLQQAEYNVTWQEQTYLDDVSVAFQSPNRANNLRTYYAPQGLIVIPRTWLEETDVPPWRIEITLAALGRMGMLNPAPQATLEAANVEAATNRIEYRRDQLVEWYVNDENGLEQGFTLSSPPAEGESPLQLDLVISGDLTPQMNATGDGIELLNSEGQPVLRYGGLVAVDAEGKSLHAWMSLEGAALSLIVEDAGAVYPITIDPLLTGLPTGYSWKYDYLIADNQFGYSVATAGDVNADGYSDVIIGSPFYDGGLTDEGIAVVFHGSEDGLENTTSWSKESDRAGANFGFSVSTAGDVDSDGDCEVIVGAPEWSESSYDGAAWVYYGSTGGLSSVPGEYYHEDAGDDAAFGISVAFAGDVNGDGYGDVIIGSSLRSSDVSQAEEGAVFVYHGSASGLNNIPNWHAEGQQLGASLGRAVATAGDVNKDGYADVIVGADRYDNGSIDEGEAFVWYGSADGVNEGLIGTPTNADWSAQINDGGAHFGAAVSTAGDVNGDGYADVIVGAPNYTNGQSNEGAARLYLGSSTGLTTGYANHDEGNNDSAQFGKSVGTAGDVNGDGYADVIVGAPYYTNDSSSEGRAFVWHGNSTGISPSRDWYDEGDAVDAWFGYSVGTAGDVNGDGYSDIIVSAPGKNSNSGSLYAYYGSSASLDDTAGWTKPSNLENAHFGHSVASAGDINADGYADVIVGAPQWDDGQTLEGGAFLYLGTANGLSSSPSWHRYSDQANAQFGWSVSTAGDVNGDGYDDVIVGAPYYKYINHDNEGMVWVYHGSSSGLETSPSFSKDSDQDNAQFGYAVGAAGDVNGDGYADVIVGSPFFDSTKTDEGGAWLYQGSADGLITKPAWHTYGDQEYAQFGASVDTAGDVNCDGYSDVIVGAPYWDNGQNNEGGAWVYLGSRNGLFTTYKWRNDGDKIGANYGFAVGAAGDVNGDGCSDIIVGAPGWDNGNENEGKAYVYHSTGTSLYLTPSWTKEADQTSANFGYSVGTAGDVNGDGYADIIVGAYLWSSGNSNEGGAWVYHGSAAGVISAPKWHAEGNQNSAHFGTAVAGAGDVNGDGYADVVVGAPWYEDGHPQEGQVYVYYGNGGKGSAYALRVYDGNPVAHLGKLETDNFWLRLIDRSPFGFGHVNYEFEVKSLRTDNNGENTYFSTSTWFDALLGISTTNYVPPASQCMPFHWRLRWIYDPATTPFMPASRWVTVPWNGWNEMDLRPSGVCISLPVILRDN
jgi:hypothetical protein